MHAEAILAAITPRTRGIIINSPGNPTGALIAESELRTIAETAARRGIWIVVDLCYEKLIYDDAPHNLPRILAETCPEHAVLCGSASKAYAMTGWRCGWQIGPPDLIAASSAIQSHSTSNVTSITQKAAVAALTGPQAPVTAMLAEYRVRRDQLHAWLTADSRVGANKPAGAFYMFVDIGNILSPDGFRTSLEFADALLAESRVAVTPGEAPFDAPGTIRISFATSMANLKEGSARLLEFVARHAPASAEKATVFGGDTQPADVT